MPTSLTGGDGHFIELTHSPFRLVRASVRPLLIRTYENINQGYWSKKLLLRTQTRYIRTMNGVASNDVREDGAPVSIRAILETGHCRSFSDLWRQFISRSGRRNSNGRFPSGKVKTWWMDLEVVPSVVTCCWRFKEHLRGQVQVTVEQLVHRDKSSMEKVSLHQGKFEVVEAFWIW